MAREKLEVSATKTFPSGAYRLTTIYDGRYQHMTYFGYTKREATRLFKEAVRNKETTAYQV